MFGNKKEKNKGFKIIIVGGGKVGVSLIEQLVNEGHDITLIDINADRVAEISNTFDVMGIIGNGATYSVQTEAGIDSADLFIAVTNTDELNLLCCTVAKRVGHCVTIARVRTPDYSKESRYLKDKLGLEMILNPDLEAAKVISRILYLPTAEEVTTFAHGLVEMVKIRIPDGNLLAGKKVMELDRGITSLVNFCAVEREGNVSIPSGQFVFQEGDLVSFVASRINIKEFLTKIGFKTGQVHDALIIGGSKSGYYLANQLRQAGIAVTIIERNMSRCEELSGLLPNVQILHADGSDEEVLEEAGIRDIESFIPLTGLDEQNVLLCMHAKEVGKAKVVTKISRNNFKGIVDGLNLGSVIYPKYIISEAIVAYVRARQNSKDSDIESLYKMFDSKVEAIEFYVEKDSSVTGVSLKNLKLKDNLLIAFILRHGNVMFPGGDDYIQREDSVMVVTTNKGFNDIQDILA